MVHHEGIELRDIFALVALQPGVRSLQFPLRVSWVRVALVPRFAVDRGVFHSGSRDLRRLTRFWLVAAKLPALQGILLLQEAQNVIPRLAHFHLQSVESVDEDTAAAADHVVLRYHDHVSATGRSMFT